MGRRRELKLTDKELKIVVTGGAGFIGSHIARYWSGRSTDIHIIDNLRSGYRSNVEGINGVVFHEGSVTDRDLVFDVLRKADYVFHLAALVSVIESVQKPVECVDINVCGLLNILDASKEFGIKKVVFSSSAAVYGDNPESPKVADMKPLPKSPYGITKLDGELYLSMYNDLFNLGTVSLRYFNVFGPGQDPKSQYSAAIPIFVNRAIGNQPIIIYGDGEQTRDFIFVKDVVKANILAAENSGAAGTFNVATGRAVTINRIARMVIEETGSSSKIIYEDERPGDIRHSLASIEETKNRLKFNPDYDLEQGMRETVRYFMNRVK
jgi:UDP-glucose 4-epimerase